MAFNREKFKALVHYVCWKTDPAKLGATKLNKTCWIADFTSYYQTGEPITDAVYIKRQFGPVPRAIVSTVQELQDEGAIVVSEKLFYGKIQKQFHALRPADTNLFTAAEITLIDGVAEYVSELHTASSISNMSHDHIWKAASDGEEIPYFTIFANPTPVSQAVREWALQELGELGAAAA